MTDPPPANPLLRALAAGQPEAYAVLYERLGRPMLRIAMTMLGKIDRAEDVVQDVFVNLARGRDRFLEIDDLDAYVFACLRNATCAKIAATKRERNHLHQLALHRSIETQSPPTIDDDANAALALLPAAQREVIVLKIDAGLTFAQIGEILGVSINTAASRYRYAMEKLRTLLREPNEPR